MTPTQNGNNPNGVVANITREGGKRNGGNRVAVREVGVAISKMARASATLEIWDAATGS